MDNLLWRRVSALRRCLRGGVWRRVCVLRRCLRGGVRWRMSALRRRMCENHGFTTTQMITAALLTLISATVAIYLMIFALNRTETENWTSRAQILCADASRAVQNWLSRASGVEPGLPADGSEKEAELVCFLAAEPDGVLLWRAFRGGTLESWTPDAENGDSTYGPFVADANDLSYRFDPDTGAYDFGPDGRAAVSVQVFCVEAAHREGAAAQYAIEQAALEGAAAKDAMEEEAIEGAAAKEPPIEEGALEGAIEQGTLEGTQSATEEGAQGAMEQGTPEGEAMEGTAEEDAMAEYFFRATVSVLPVGGGEGVVNTFIVRPLLAPPMRGIQRESIEAEEAEETQETEEAQETEPVEESQEAEAFTEAETGETD